MPLHEGDLLTGNRALDAPAQATLGIDDVGHDIVCGHLAGDGSGVQLGLVHSGNRIPHERGPGKVARYEFLKSDVVGDFIAHARVLLERFRVEYNTEHLDSSLGYLTPAEHAEAHPAGAA